jgi:hypothetical protein
MKRHRKKRFLSEIKKVPIISSVCEKVGLSRNTVYRWLREDPLFKKEMSQSLSLGRESINDLAESALINLIQSGKLGAIRYWLGNNKDNYVRPMLQRHWKPIEAKKELPDKVIVEIVNSKYDHQKIKDSNARIIEERKNPSYE